jgi:hypothetical protein
MIQRSDVSFHSDMSNRLSLFLYVNVSFLHVKPNMPSVPMFRCLISSCQVKYSLRSPAKCYSPVSSQMCSFVHSWNPFLHVMPNMTSVFSRVKSICSLILCSDVSFHSVKSNMTSDPIRIGGAHQRYICRIGRALQLYICQIGGAHQWHFW